MKEGLVKDIMQQKVITLHPKDHLVRAKEVFEEYDIHHIPIVVMDRVVGIVSMGDIIVLEGLTTNSFDKFIKERTFFQITMDEIMTKRVVCIDAGETITKAVKMLLEYRVNALPVLQDDMLVGIITHRDLLRVLQDKLLNAG